MNEDYTEVQEVYAELIRDDESDKAILVEDLVAGRVWIPRSQIIERTDLELDGKPHVTLLIPEWLYIDKGFANG